MTTWFTSRQGVITLTVLIAIGAGLALLRAVASQGLSTRTVAASLLVLCFVLFGFGGALFTGRVFLNWQIQDTSSHLLWERGFIMAAVLATVLGLALLEDLLRTAGDTVLSRLGLVTYLIGAVVVLVAETTYLGKGGWSYPQVVLYVVLAFLAQAALGVALLRTGLVTGWVGWATVIWNTAWLIILPIFSPRDIYYPVLHHVAPLVIGIALLTQG
jgi:hypothetical protein